MQESNSFIHPGTYSRVEFPPMYVLTHPEEETDDSIFAYIDRQREREERERTMAVIDRIHSYYRDFAGIHGRFPNALLITRQDYYHLLKVMDRQYGFEIMEYKKFMGMDIIITLDEQTRVALIIAD